MNGFNNFDETDREYSLSPTDDLVSFWWSKVKGQGHSRPKYASTSMLVRRSPTSNCFSVLFLISFCFWL